MESKFTIDEELSKILPEPDKKELEQLERNILNDKTVRDPLVVWKDRNILVGGMHRYKLAQKHNIPFVVVYKEFVDREQAKTWIALDAIGKRNIRPAKRIQLAKQYLTPILKQKAKENLTKGGQGLTISSKVNVREEIAKAAGVSQDTVQKVEEIEREGSEEDKKALQQGTVKINTIHKKIKRNREKSETTVKYENPNINWTDAKVETDSSENKSNIAIKLKEYDFVVNDISENEALTIMKMNDKLVKLLGQIHFKLWKATQNKLKRNCK